MSRLSRLVGRLGRRRLRNRAWRRGAELANHWHDVAAAPAAGQPPAVPADNPLWDYFAAHAEGPGIWKWNHYFDVYHRYFRRFVGRPVKVLEIGIFSGGSLGMWTSYFGDGCYVYGVDIESACRAYAADNVTVFIGDQANRSFWQQFRQDVGAVDILIDDGGHTPEQQMVTLEEMLPHLRPGGVYLCEDIHGVDNPLIAFAAGLVSQLNAMQPISGAELKSDVTPFQQSVYAMHIYPYLLVIERHMVPPTEFAAPRHGTQWQPFL